MLLVHVGIQEAIRLAAISNEQAPAGDMATTRVGSVGSSTVAERSGCDTMAACDGDASWDSSSSGRLSTSSWGTGVVGVVGLIEPPRRIAGRCAGRSADLPAPMCQPKNAAAPLGRGVRSERLTALCDGGVFAVCGILTSSPVRSPRVQDFRGHQVVYLIFELQDVVIGVLFPRDTQSDGACELRLILAICVVVDAELRREEVGPLIDSRAWVQNGSALLRRKKQTHLIERLARLQLQERVIQ